MQDKYQQRKYARRGWKRMKVILDREMPVDSSRRRVPLFVWLTGAAVALLVAAGLYFSTHRNATPQLPGPEETSKPMAAAESRNEVKITESEVLAEYESAAGQSPASQGKLAEKAGHPEQAESGVSIPSRVQGKNGRSDGNPLAVAENRAGTKVTSQPSRMNGSRAAETGKPILRDPVIKPKMIETESVILPQHSDLARSTTALSLLARTIYLDGTAPVADLPERFISPALPVTRPLESKSRAVHLALGIRGTVNSAAGGMQGFGGGPEARWQLSRKVTLFSGVQYEGQQKDGFLLFAERDDASFSGSPITVINDPSGNAVNAVSMDVDAESVESLTNSFHFLHIPAGVEFFVRRPFSLELGVRYSRLLGAPAREKIALVDDDQLQQDINQVSGVSRNSLFDHDFVRKNDVSVLLGANLYLWRRLAFHVEYNHGLLSIFRGGDDTISASRNRMLSLGLRYHFSRV